MKKYRMFLKNKKLEYRFIDSANTFRCTLYKLLDSLKVLFRLGVSPSVRTFLCLHECREDVSVNQEVPLCRIRPNRCAR